MARGDLSNRAWQQLQPLLPVGRGVAGPGPTTAASSMASAGCCGPARPGATCPTATGRGRPATSASPAGTPTAPGTGFCRRCTERRRPPAGSPGNAASTPRSFAPISTPPAPTGDKKGDPRTGGSRPRAQPGWPDDEGASLRRRQGPTAVGGRDGRSAAREHPTGSGPRRHPGAPAAGPSPQAPGSGADGSGVQLPALSTGTAAAGHPARHPRAARPAGVAAGEGAARRASAGLRPRSLPPTQRD